MAITYAWDIAQMEVYPTQAGRTNVVFNIHWKLRGVSGIASGSAYGMQEIALNLGLPHIPYTSITKAQALGWIHAAMGSAQVAAHEANVAKQIADKLNPPVVTPALPWAAS